MTAIKLEKLVPRVVFATPFRLFAIYISLFCAAVAGTFIYVNAEMQGFLSHEAEAAVQADSEALATRYREDGLPALSRRFPSVRPRRATRFTCSPMAAAERLAGNLDMVATDLWNTQDAAQFVYRKRAGGQFERGLGTRRRGSQAICT